MHSQDTAKRPAIAWDAGPQTEGNRNVFFFFFFRVEEGAGGVVFL